MSSIVIHICRKTEKNPILFVLHYMLICRQASPATACGGGGVTLTEEAAAASAAVGDNNCEYCSAEFESAEQLEKHLESHNLADFVAVE